MNINDKELLNYIKNRYPKIIVTPVLLSDKLAESLGFILSDKDKIIDGYVSKDGRLCKLKEPVDLSHLDNEKFKQIINSIPLVSGVNKEKIIDIISKKDTINEEEHKNAMSDLKKAIQIGLHYNVLLTTTDKESGNGVIFTSKEDEKTINELRKEIQELQEFKNCRDTLLKSQDEIKLGIEKYKQDVANQIKEIIKNSNDKSAALEEIYKNVMEQTNKLESFLNGLIKYQESLNKTTNEDNSKVKELEETNKKIKDELDQIKQEFEQEKLKQVQIDNCAEQIIKDKNEIINKMEEYKIAWKNWVKQNTYSKEDIDIQKDAILNQLAQILEKLTIIIRESGNNKQLIDNCKEIKEELEKQCREQLEKLANFNEELKLQIKEKDKQLSEKDKQLSDKDNEILEKNKDIIQKTNEIEDLKNKVNELLQKNVGAVEEIIEKQPVECEDTFNQLKNIFTRQIQIINSLEVIINKNSEKISKELRNQFKKIKDSIDKLDLAELISKDYNKDDCDKINTIFKIWNDNQKTFNNNLLDLINLNEDIGGAVRIYIRIKPTKESEQTANIEIFDDSHSLTVTCNNKSKEYGRFYQVFPPEFTNKDVFRGEQTENDDIRKLELNSDVKIGEGLYNTFKQVESGYSIVLFGYGVSGSGKSYSLLGDQSTNAPGLIHYGLANLNGINNISIDNIFELYVHDAKPNIKAVRGDIINLSSELPIILKEITNNKVIEYNHYTKNETSEFNSNVNVKNININDINTLTYSLEQYRIEKKRIKQTPNNPNSSRSHLFIIFKITFDTGKIGYITIIDAGGKESTEDIFSQFTQNRTAKYPATTPETIYSSSTKSHTAENIIQEDIDEGKYDTQFLNANNYTADDIANIYKEGYYINESLKHLAHFFNLKNNISTKGISYWTNPLDEYNNKVYESKNCLMIPVLEYLDKGLNKDSSKPTKFITIVHTRRDNKFCDETFKTLDFAQQIKSS
jgi:hypothetical protein